MQCFLSNTCCLIQVNTEPILSIHFNTSPMTSTSGNEMRGNGIGQNGSTNVESMLSEILSVSCFSWLHLAKPQDFKKLCLLTMFEAACTASAAEAASVRSGLKYFSSHLSTFFSTLCSVLQTRWAAHRGPLLQPPHL